MKYTLLFLAFSLMLLLSGLFFYAKSLPLNETRTQLYQHVSKLEDENQRLVYELETLESYKNKEKKAKQLNMVPAKRIHYIALKHENTP